MGREINIGALRIWNRGECGGKVPSGGKAVSSQPGGIDTELLGICAQPENQIAGVPYGIEWCDLRPIAKAVLRGNGDGAVAGVAPRISIDPFG